MDIKGLMMDIKGLKMVIKGLMMDIEGLMLDIKGLMMVIKGLMMDKEGFNPVVRFTSIWNHLSVVHPITTTLSMMQCRCLCSN